MGGDRGGPGGHGHSGREIHPLVFQAREVVSWWAENPSTCILSERVGHSGQCIEIGANKEGEL